MSESIPSLEHNLQEFLGRPDYRPLKNHELAKAMKLPAHQRVRLRHMLRRMEREGRVVRLRKNRWALPAPEKFLTGEIRVHPQGFGFVVAEQPGQPDLYISKQNLGTALHGDRVQVTVTRSSAGKRAGTRRVAPESRAEGKIVRVLERGHPTLVGLVKKTRFYSYVIPDNPRFLHEVRVADTVHDLEPREDHKVVVRLHEWTDAAKPLLGTLIEDLGPLDRPGLDMLSLMRSYGLQSEFPPDAVSEADRFSPTPPEASLRGRQDLRGWITLTIDPENARDFDDAVSLVELPGGHLQLGVHIADVAHYVPPGSALDREAFERGNSVYLVDRAVSMLPAHLTSRVCSLLAREDRLTHSVTITLNHHAEPIETRTFASVIRSSARLNYDQVQAFFDDHRDHGIEESLLDTLRRLRTLARTLRARRLAAGSIDLTMPEVKCRLNEEGQVLRIEKRGAYEAYQLIEEFMLLANCAVAQTFARHQIPAIYRIHEAPNDAQWAQMEEDLKPLGIHLGGTNRETVKEIARRAAASPLAHVINLALLRNFKRAMYSAESDEHFALAFDHYTHFTSPIRRYPDLVVHRILSAQENGRPAPYGEEELARIAAHCSATEREADEAEEESLEVKRVDYYHRLLWEGNTGPFPGIITRVVPKGLIVELSDTLQRGLIPFSTLTDDYYRVSDDGFRATGQRHHKVWKVGDVVSVLVTRVDTSRRLVDFQFNQPSAGRRKTKKKISG